MNLNAERPTQADLAQLIKAFGPNLTHFGPRKAEEIRSLGTMFDLDLPPDYRRFLSSYGALAVNDLKILGLVDLEHSDLSAEAVTLMLRLTYADMPLDIIPVEDLGDGQYACLMCSEGKNDESPVLIVDIENPSPTEKLPILAPSFRDYLYNRLLILLEPSILIKRNAEDIQNALLVFEEHILKYHDQFQYDHAKGGKLPRNHDWRPYRYCIQDVVFGITVVRHLREANCLEVDVFLTADIPEYGPFAGVMALITFLLSEAYKCGGTMEIRFTREVEGGQVPDELQVLAKQHSISFSQADSGIISSAEAKSLYAAITGFSPRLREAITELEKKRLTNMARACYVIHHGVWTKEQVELLVLGSERPDSILGGLAKPDQWHLYYHDLLHARAALLAGMFERVLQQRVHKERETDFDLEDDLRQIDISFDDKLYAKRFFCEESVPLPIGWLQGVEEEHALPERTSFQVLVRARNAIEMTWQLGDDITAASKHHQATGEPTFILLPQDFYQMPKKSQTTLVEEAKANQIGLLICPEALVTFDAEAAQKLASSRIIRQ